MTETARPFRCPCGDPLLPVLRPLLEPLLGAARDGRLPHQNAADLASGKLALRLLPEAFEGEHHAAVLSRALYQQSVSWALWSDDYLDQLAGLLLAHGCTRVLEVAAGSGVLAAPMQRRGLAWCTTDQRPSQIGLPAEQTPVACDALAALERFGGETDAVFWAWWPAGDQTDAQLVEACARRRLPAVFVSEPCGGCTGSTAVWAADPEPLFSKPGVDLPRWPGMQDRTWVVGASLLGREGGVGGTTLTEHNVEEQ